uniref:UDP-N-acetylglucosamine transferase subunit ALG14 n=1 Tax=Panagrellus redivivus TaxID=6233 RepID=A0A7E4W917_PANRE
MFDALADALSSSPTAVAIIFGTIFVFVVINVFLTLFIAHTMRHAGDWPGLGQTVTAGAADPLRLCAVIGSGGHTTEMTNLLKTLSPDLFANRTYIVAETDKMGIDKVMAVEKEIHSRSSNPDSDKFTVETIPRSREVGQSYVSSIFTTIWASLASVKTVWSANPDVLLVNGPGTCLPVCVIAYFLDLIRLRNTRIVFVESVCRVKSLSLTGKILYKLRLADVILVQWKDLCKLYPRVDYLGVLN